MVFYLLVLVGSNKEKSEKDKQNKKGKEYLSFSYETGTLILQVMEDS